MNGLQNIKIQFVLKGFRDATGSREFVFEGIKPDRTRAEYTVRTNLALTRQFGIRLQELPLLCRGMLDRLELDEARRAFTYSEREMGEYAQEEAARAAALRNRRPPKRPQNHERLGAAWRTASPAPR